MNFPHDVTGWLTEQEGNALAGLAAGLRVLEIGSYCGRSTICLAQTAAEVHVVDTFDGLGTPNPRDTLAEFRDNIIRYGLAEKITAHVGTATEATLPSGFGLAFIDASHDYLSVMADAEVAKSVLSPDGLLCFHDYRPEGEGDEGVRNAVDSLLRAGGTLVERHGSLAVVKPSRRQPPDEPIVCLAMPRRDETVCYGAMVGCIEAVSRPTRVLTLGAPSGSLLNHCFNGHWAQALDCRDKHGATHFAMIHNDVCPHRGWLTTLLDELTALDADVVSAVVPIKNEHGLTSTAVYDGDPWKRRRLSLSEVMELPETFGTADTGQPLLLNTGLWVCDLRKPWTDGVVFRTRERIVKTASGRRAEVIPEDWLFSHELQQQGCRLFATRKVRLTHEGSASYPNHEAWGAWSTDEATDLPILEAANG